MSVKNEGSLTGNFSLPTIPTSGCVWILCSQNLIGDKCNCANYIRSINMRLKYLSETEENLLEEYFSFPELLNGN